MKFSPGSTCSNTAKCDKVNVQVLEEKQGVMAHDMVPKHGLTLTRSWMECVWSPRQQTASSRWEPEGCLSPPFVHYSWDVVVIHS